MRLSDCSSDVCSSYLPAASVEANRIGPAQLAQCLDVAADRIDRDQCREAIDEFADLLPPRDLADDAGVGGTAAPSERFGIAARKQDPVGRLSVPEDRKSTRLNYSH